jgi:NapH/MauN family ferredoxin-type protein
MTIRKYQIARRTVQISVVVGMLLIPVVARYTNYLSARELDRTIEKWDGTLQGEILEFVDHVLRLLPGGEKPRVDRMVRDRTRTLERTQLLRGGPWSIQIGDLSMTDPLAGAESIIASRSIAWVLAISLVIPLAATLLLGRAFCSWICPMGLLLDLNDKLRKILRFLEIRPRNVIFPRATKFILLGFGIVVVAVTSKPLLAYVYPPAILGREAHDFVFGIFDHAERGRFGFWTSGLTWASLIILGIAMFEVVVSRRWWCRYICPGGALYILLGRFHPLKIQRSPAQCTDCGVCVQVCPMGLDPMHDEVGSECDGCGLCVSHCDDEALHVKLHGHQDRLIQIGKEARKAAALLILVAVLPSQATAHHILGIPHYAYDEQYPQTPVLTYRVDAGPYEIRMTGYPGHPQPGERCSLHLYINRRDNGALFDKTVRATVFQDVLIGDDPIIYGPQEAVIEERVFKFHPTFGEVANYTVRIELDVEGVPWIIDLPMVAGEPGSPYTVMGSVAGGLVAFLVVIRAIRIKMRRRSRTASPIGRGAVA